MPDEVRGLLEAHPPESRDLALEARELVRRLVRQADEGVLRAWKTIAYGLGRQFCAIPPYESWIDIPFQRGAALPDPAGLLQGTGKSERHVRVASRADLPRRPLAAPIRVASRSAHPQRSWLTPLAPQRDRAKAAPLFPGPLLRSHGNVFHRSDRNTRAPTPPSGPGVPLHPGEAADPAVQRGAAAVVAQRAATGVC
jgi:hypothetical protein